MLAVGTHSRQSFLPIKNSANSMENMQAAAEAGQGSGGGGECVSIWINHMKFNKGKCQSPRWGNPGSVLQAQVF